MPASAYTALAIGIYVWFYPNKLMMRSPRETIFQR